MLGGMIYLLIEKEFLFFWSTILFYSNIKLKISKVIKIFNKYTLIEIPLYVKNEIASKKLIKKFNCFSNYNVRIK